MFHKGLGSHNFLKQRLTEVSRYVIATEFCNAVMAIEKILPSHAVASF